MKTENEMKISFISKSENEGFARAAVSAFAALCDPCVEDIADIRTAVSEAVTNCIVHAYADSDTIGLINITSRIIGNKIYIKISDKGCGIEDIKKAMEPLFTTKPEQERSGLGFAVMESCSDKVRVSSKKGKGTTVTLIFTVKEKELK